MQSVTTARRRAEQAVISKRSLLVALLAVRRGDVDAIWRDSRRDVEHLALYCSRRMDLPATIELSDVQQEVAIALWRAALDWDSSLGPRLLTHAVWRAITGTRKWLHSQREAKGKRDFRQPSRYAQTVSSFYEGSDLAYDEKLELLMHREDRVEQIYDALDHYRALLRQMSERDALIVGALVRNVGSEEQAVEAIWKDRAARRVMRVATKRKVRVVVRRVAAKLRRAA